MAGVRRFRGWALAAVNTELEDGKSDSADGVHVSV